LKFTVDIKAFRKMVATVGKKMPGQRADLNIRVFASAARLFVESNLTTAGTEALVFSDGQFIIRYKRFRSLLGTYRTQKNLTIEAEDGWMKIGGFSHAVCAYSPSAEPPGQFLIFPASDMGVSGSAGAKRNCARSIGNFIPPAPSEGESKAKDQSQADSEPVTNTRPHQEAQPEGEYLENEYVVEPAQSALRILCLLSQTTPPMMVGIARALYALDRLPRRTKGVDFFVSVCERIEINVGYREVGFYFRISDRVFEVGDRIKGCEKDWEKESFIPTYTLRWSWSDSIPDEDYWDESVGGWGYRFKKLLLDRKPPQLIVMFEDKSEPGCMGLSGEG